VYPCLTKEYKDCIFVSVADGDVYDTLNELEHNDLRDIYRKAIGQMSTRRCDTVEWDLQSRNRNLHFKVEYNNIKNIIIQY
jgi:hypothetical protein